MNETFNIILDKTVIKELNTSVTLDITKKSTSEWEKEENSNYTLTLYKNTPEIQDKKIKELIEELTEVKQNLKLLKKENEDMEKTMRQYEDLLEKYLVERRAKNDNNI